jgi:DNA-binding Xre family transcriptional regulator
VRDWLKSLPAAARREIGADIGQVQWTWPVGKPLVDGFGLGLFEVRSSLDGNTYRVLFLLGRSRHGAAAWLPEEGSEDTQVRPRARSPPDEGRGEVVMKKKYIGSTLDSLLDELGEREEVELLTQKKLLAAKIERAMARQRMTQVELAKAMRTSRTVVHRLLDPHDTSVTLATLSKASKALGVRLLRVA